MKSGRRVPESLLKAGLQPVWSAVRHKLDRSGSQRPGTIARPDLDQNSELTLESLLGRRLTKRLDLDGLEKALVAQGLGENLSDALTRLGHPPSAAAARRRLDRTRSEAARAALNSAVAAWGEPWAASWAHGITSSGLLAGLDRDETMDLVRKVRRLLDRLDEPERSRAGRADSTASGPGTSRTELAAELFGSSHALDDGQRLASAVSHALRRLVGHPLERRELWEACGISSDRVSAPVLVWSAPVAGDSPLAQVVRAAALGMLPLHINLLALLRHPLTVPVGTEVLVVENPRLLEAAAERRLPRCVVAANGNPTTAVTTLLHQMLQSGASVRYHGDFDAAGIGICRRMHEFGCSPWLMDLSDYRDAIGSAELKGVQLHSDSKDCGSTPWDPRLEAGFNSERLIIHEEYIVDRVLGEFSKLKSDD